MKIFKRCKNTAIALIVFGCIMFIFGISATQYIEYQGASYTGIQNAAADTANNILKVGGILVAVLGGLLLSYSEIKAFEYEENKKNHQELLETLGGKALETSVERETIEKSEESAKQSKTIYERVPSMFKYTELDILGDAGSGKCLFCHKEDNLRRCKVKNSMGVRDIRICQTCISHMTKED